eukprot:scaffold329953_cov53-Tisochrysis_lutea.AAC.2
MRARRRMGCRTWLAVRTTALASSSSIQPLKRGHRPHRPSWRRATAARRRWASNWGMVRTVAVIASDQGREHGLAVPPPCAPTVGAALQSRP